MGHIKSVFYYSLLAALVPCNLDAGLRVGNLSRNNAQGYQQVNNMRYGSDAATQAAIAANPAPVELPIPVSNGELAEQIKSGDTNAQVGMSDLERCSMIYPNGEFAWARPTVGAGVGGAPTCTAIVEMRVIGAGENGGDAVVARANLAAGDTVNCNIGAWPHGTLLPAVENVEFPPDSEPTMDDVIAVMNQEQKENSAIKIVAGAVIGGIGGNITGKPEPGSDSLLGGGKSKTTNTIIGALGGAALMAGNSYAGKVGGDVILSAGVNAAAGGVMGNIVASGDSVLRIEQCEVDGVQQKCLWGYVNNVSTISGTPYVSKKNPDHFMVCDDKGLCKVADLDTELATVDGYDGQLNRTTKTKMTLSDIFVQDQFEAATHKSCYQNDKMSDTYSVCDDIWIRLSGDVKNIESRIPAMVVGVSDKSFGWKKSDWGDFKTRYASAEVVGRTGRGVATNLNLDGTTPDGERIVKWVLGNSDINFSPSYQDSDDGGLIALDNKARLKDTLTGAGIGGGLGAFVGYQGAQKDIEERWVNAVREYKDRLQKVYCATGNRFISYYNDIVFIPNMPEK